MAVIGTFSKQPREVIDIKVSLTQFFANRGDALATYEIDVPEGITKVSDTLMDNAIVMLISGGNTGTTYKLQIRVTTDTGVIVEDEVNVAVLEV